jgi:hypothetical protein
MEVCNYSTQFINIIKNLYRNATSKIMINGRLSRCIRIRRSVRQGCPLEPLIQAINSKVQRMELQHSNVKSLAYADDINFVVKSDEEIDRAFEAIELFCSESNAKINMPKSAFLRINNCKVGPQKSKRYIV